MNNAISTETAIVSYLSAWGESMEAEVFKAAARLAGTSEEETDAVIDQLLDNRVIVSSVVRCPNGGTFPSLRLVGQKPVV